MTFLDCAEAPLVVGDDYDVRRTMTGVPEGSTVVAAWLTLKQSEFDIDAAAVLQKQITPTSVPGVGRIEDDGTSDSSGDLAGKAVVLFQLTAAETALFDPYSQYFYDIQIQTSTSPAKIKTIERGVLCPKRQATKTSA